MPAKFANSEQRLLNWYRTNVLVAHAKDFINSSSNVAHNLFHNMLYAEDLVKTALLYAADKKLSSPDLLALAMTGLFSVYGDSGNSFKELSSGNRVKQSLAGWNVFAQQQGISNETHHLVGEMITNMASTTEDGMSFIYSAPIHVLEKFLRDAVTTQLAYPMARARMRYLAQEMGVNYDQSFRAQLLERGDKNLKYTLRAQIVWRQALPLVKNWVTVDQ